MPPDERPAAPAPSKGDRTRHALLHAAIVRFAREGFRGTSVADVCRDAALSTTASYPYFANKEVSFVAIDENLDGWGGVMMQALLDHLPDHSLAARIVKGLEPDFTMRLLYI